MIGKKGIAAAFVFFVMILFVGSMFEKVVENYQKDNPQFINKIENKREAALLQKREELTNQLIQESKQ